MAHKKANTDRKVAYFFGVVLLGITGVCLWLMASVPPAPTQEVEREIAYEKLISR